VVTLDWLQFDAVYGAEGCGFGHSLTVDAVKVAPVAAASFASGVIVWFVSYAPLCASSAAVGAATTVGVIVLVTTFEPESVTTYLIGVASPVNGPVHDAPAGVFAAEHGVNVTTPFAIEYVPSPGITRLVPVHDPFAVPVTHSRAVDAVNDPLDSGVSFASGLIVCAAPCTPVDVSAVAADAIVNRAFTVPVPPIATVDAFDVIAPPDAVTVPDPPAATVVSTAVSDAELTKRTL